MLLKCQMRIWTKNALLFVIWFSANACIFIVDIDFCVHFL